jgi:hypothetical protein
MIRAERRDRGGCSDFGYRASHSLANAAGFQRAGSAADALLAVWLHLG